MTGYIVRERGTRRVWTGIPGDWSRREADAHVFQFAGIAAAGAFLHGGVSVDFDIEPIFVDGTRAKALGFAA